MRKSFKILVVGILIGIFSIVSFAATTSGKTLIEAWLSPDVTIELKGEILEMTDVNGDTVYPIVYNGTTYAPLRAISEALNLPVGWNGETKTVSLGYAPPTDEKKQLTGEQIEYTRDTDDGEFAYLENATDATTVNGVEYSPSLICTGISGGVAYFDGVSVNLHIGKSTMEIGGKIFIPENAEIPNAYGKDDEDGKIIINFNDIDTNTTLYTFSGKNGTLKDFKFDTNGASNIEVYFDADYGINNSKFGLLELYYK